MAEDYSEFININYFMLVNHEPTRHWSGTESSLIDFFVTNSVNHIDNVITKHSCIADHGLVSVLYHTEIILEKPQFRMTQNYTSLTRENLIFLMDNDPIFNGIINLTSVDKIWNTLIVQLNM